MFSTCLMMSFKHLSDDEESNHEDASDTGAAPKQQQQVIPQTTAISNIKLPILKKEEYDIWAMEMEHYLEYIDNEVWKVIQNGNSKKRISIRKDGIVRILSPVTAAEIQAVEKENKAKNILLMAIPKEHMRRFHGMDDAKEIWEAIRTRFGGNANSKKMQKAIFKQQFEAFKISSSEGLEKGYDIFQQLLSQLEAHGAKVSTEDANHKFLRSLPATWSNLAMTMRTKPEIDTLSVDDLYNNLRVFEQEIQGASKTSSSAQNVAFVSQSKSSTNKVKSGFTGAYITCTPSTSSTNIPKKEVLVGTSTEEHGLDRGDLLVVILDNGTEFKNRDMLEFCGNKGIKQEYSNARTPQQNGVAERMNRTLIEAARTMLADSLLPTNFRAEAVSTACYIFNRFDRISDEGFLVGYSLNSKAYRVYNLVTKRVEVNLHVNFLEEKPNVKGVGYRWMFDIDYLTDSMNYIPVSLENQANHAGTAEETNSAGSSIASEEVEIIVVPSAVKIPEEKGASRTSSTTSKQEETLIEPQKEMKDSSTHPKIQVFRRELEEIALKDSRFWKRVGRNCPKAFRDTVPTEKQSAKQNQELMLFSSIFKSSKETITKINSILCLPVLYLRRNLKRLLKLSKMTVGLKPCKKNCYSSSYNKFQMSSMGELTFFLGLQVKQNKAGIFISQDKYVAEILKKFDLVNVKAAITPMETKVALTKDEEAIDVMSTWVLETPRPLLPTMLLVATTNPNAGQEHHVVAQSQPSSSTLPVPFTSSPPVQSPPPIPTPTPIPETKPEPIGHTFEEPSPTHQHFSPPQEQAQGQMTMDDLLQVVPQLMSRIDSLETYLKQTKLTMGSVIVKLVKKVKKLEGILKRRNVVLSNSEEEELEAQGRKREEQVEDISPTTLEEAKTLSKVASQKPKSIDKGRRSIPSPDKGQREGKAPMIIEEAPKKSKEQILQEEASLAEAIRLDTLQKKRRLNKYTWILS
ncbi:ribonuclease H-like domain-containing protein [Tanacetum coccineum]